MTKISASTSWQRQGARFTDNRYSRAHVWQFDGGAEIPASSSPHIVPSPMSDETAVDPEEAFVASLSSCHLLWFLSIVAQEGFIVDRYTDQAHGRMQQDSLGNYVISDVTLTPEVDWSGDHEPSPDQIHRFHELAHQKCFIANSVKTAVHVQPRI